MADISDSNRASDSWDSLSDALRREDFAIIFDWFAFYFFRVAIAIFFLILASALPSKGPDALRIVAFSFVFAGACTVCGWLLGLLFGIPRTLSRPTLNPTPNSAADSTKPPAIAVPNRVNTNLEDVSDWLTKTLVGVGLTQLYFVPHYIWVSADKINKAGLMWDGAGQMLVLALFLYFAPGGFWLGYIGTRTILTKLFDKLEGPPQSSVATSLSPDELKLDAQGKLKPATTPEVKNADAKLLSFPMTALTTSRELAAWGAANARNNNLESATVALQQATRADPSDKAAIQALAKVYTAQSRQLEAQQLLKGDEDSDVALFNALYEPAPAGFTKAIEIGSRLGKRPDADKNLNLHIWLACAYGQQHRYEKANGNAEAAEAARLKVIEEIKAAVRISPDAAKPLLRSFWQPAPGDQDDDLSSLPSGDPDLTRLLN